MYRNCLTDGSYSTASLTALGSKSHLGSFAQVLSQHYEVDQRLRMTAVLNTGKRKTGGKRVKESILKCEQDSNRNTTVEAGQ